MLSRHFIAWIHSQRPPKVLSLLVLSRDVSGDAGIAEISNVAEGCYGFVSTPLRF